jgi:glycosyltransferase involved in cell wall biosynthesis
MLRVTHVINGLGVGGAELALLRLIEDTHQRVKHVVISLTGLDVLRPRFERIPGVELRFLHARRGVRGALAFRACALEASRASGDILHGWLKQACVASAIAAMWAPSLRKVPLVWGVRDTVDPREAGTTERIALQVGRHLSPRCDLLLCNSRLALQQFLSAGYRPRQADFLHNGVDLPSLKSVAASRAKWRKCLEVGPDEPVVMHVGSLHPAKDPGCLLRCVQALRTRAPEIVFVRVGRGPSGREASPEADSLMHAQAFRHLGEVSDVPEVVAAADVLLLTSRREGCPNVVLEAMAAGVPVASTDVGDVRAIVGDAGRIGAVGDAHGLAESVLALLEARRRDGGRPWEVSRERIRSNHLRASVHARFESIYRDLLGSRPEAVRAARHRGA